MERGVLVVGVLVLGVLVVVGLSYVGTQFSPGFKGSVAGNEMCIDLLESIENKNNFNNRDMRNIEGACSDLSMGDAKSYAEEFGVLGASGDGCSIKPRADITEDGFVDFADVLQVLRNWKCGERDPPCIEPPADVNQDGFVDFADIVEVLSEWTGPDVPFDVCECIDSLDNEVPPDGLIDEEDPGCWDDLGNPESNNSALDYEERATSECQDGLDNDDDTLIDWPDDDDCTSLLDWFEGTDEPGGEWTDPFPAELIDTSGLYGVGFGTIQFLARDGNILTAYTYRGTGFQPNGRILFIQHGNSRTAESYLRSAAPVAERNDALAIAIEFSEEDYPSGFTTVVGTDGTPSGRDYDPDEWRQPEDYLYSEIEHVFEAVRIEFDEPDIPGYYFWGHSAGGQFGHRLLTFLPDTPAIRAVVANSGWYTLPSFGGGHDRNYYMPYGLQGTPLSDDDAKVLLESPMVVMVGEEDILTADEDETLRDTTQANYQGINRFERAHFYYDTGELQALDYGTNFGWKIDVVPGAKHSKSEMMPSGEWYLFSEDEPCAATTAAQVQGLVVNEIHADPASSLEGDANNDGIRDPNDDEFIELVNNGPIPICLTGWTITDLSSPDRERHNFPIGSVVPPGKAVVVFGGGVPTGYFGGTPIHWAVYEGDRLSLSNLGDVITIKDYEGTIFKKISWGDCGGQTCGNEHIPFHLSIDQSATRWPDITGVWVKHLDVSGYRYTPGTKSSGAYF